MESAILTQKQLAQRNYATPFELPFFENFIIFFRS